MGGDWAPQRALVAARMAFSTTQSEALQAGKSLRPPVNTAQPDIGLFPGSIPSVFGTHRPETASTTRESPRDGALPRSSGFRGLSRTFFI